MAYCSKLLVDAFWWNTGIFYGRNLCWSIFFFFHFPFLIFFFSHSLEDWWGCFFLKKFGSTCGPNYRLYISLHAAVIQVLFEEAKLFFLLQVLTEYILVSVTSAVTVTIAGVVKEAVTILVYIFFRYIFLLFNGFAKSWLFTKAWHVAFWLFFLTQ